jgi:phosphopantothenoylcysteine decarboxylase / phosphopantothenate---cysteine ligase
MMGRVLLGVTGGIAAYKSVELLRLLQQAGSTVRVMQTRASLDFVGAATFAALTGEPTITDEQAVGGQFPHLDAGREAHVLVIAPATAATLARLASGLADDVLAATYLAFDGPVIVAPAMNVRMWDHPSTQRNLEQLRADGVLVVAPDSGLLACGDVGAGRLAPVEEIAAAVQAALDPPARPRDLAGRTLLVTAGGTREPIDSVRAITNRSSGRMGLALARAAAERGAEVRLIVTATVDPALYAGLTPTAVVERAADLRAALEQHVPGSDAVLMAAAVSDFTPQPVDGKLERGAAMELRLEPVPDLIAEVASRRAGGPTPLLVAFAAEHGPAGLERARRKREAKGVDIIVHNDVQRADAGFEVDTNDVTIIGPTGERSSGLVPKLTAAHAILDEVQALLRAGATVGR